MKVSGTLEFSPPSHFSGRVNSKLGGCESGASFAIWRYDNANDTTYEVVASGKANKKGVFSAEVQAARAGQYDLYVMPRKIRVHDSTVKCQAFTSIRYNF